MSENTPARRRRRPSAARNLAILAGVVVVFAFIAVAARFVDHEVRLIFPDGFDAKRDAAMREAPENAYHGLVEANSLLKPWPGELQELRRRVPDALQDRRWPDFDLDAGAGLESLREQLDEVVLAWLHDIDPALDKMHEAVQRPYFRMPQPVVIYRDNPEPFGELALAALTQGTQRARFHGDLPAGLARLGDCVRLARLLCEEDSYFLRMRALEEEVCRQLVLIMQEQPHAEVVQQILEVLVTLGMPWPDRSDALKQYWQQLDTGLALGFGPGGGLRALFFGREMQFAADGIRNNMDFYYRLAKAPLSGHNALFAERPDLLSDDWRFEGRMRSNRNAFLLTRVCYTQLHYCRALIAAVLARYRLHHEAYPDSLETAFTAAGVPLPVDPVGAMPWGYRTEGAGYVLYTSWRDGVDQGGADESDFVLLRVAA
jgi:hypothetical protein